MRSDEMRLLVDQLWHTVYSMVCNMVLVHVGHHSPLLSPYTEHMKSRIINTLEQLSFHPLAHLSLIPNVQFWSLVS